MSGPVEVTVTRAKFLVVQGEDESFALMNLDTKKAEPISKEEMLALAENLDSWFSAMCLKKPEGG